MGGKKFHKNKFKSRDQNLTRRVIQIREKNLIESNYEFLKCSISKAKLVALGKVRPTDFSIEYTVKITYDGLRSPKVFVIDPEIDYHDDIHMYPSDNSLCLYHPESDGFIWDFREHHIHDTIIPWAIEWFVFYELYLITGKWEHPFKPHKTIK